MSLVTPLPSPLPILLIASGALADMGLGISFSSQPGQNSNVEVNGTRVTSSAGGQDDGGNENGALITVGGLDDSNDNPSNPLARLHHLPH